MINKILIFTDGACTGNPGPGGWASILAMPDGTVQELGGSSRDTTNNRMEMMAAIRALEVLEPTSEQSTIWLYTDSTYLIRGITQWIFGWRSRGWKNAEGKDVANRELWEELSRQTSRLKPADIQWKYIRGHAGFPGNERCDQVAVSFATGKSVSLYNGPRDSYFVNLDQVPSEDKIPEQKKTDNSKSVRPSGAKSGGGPTTYLSYYGGIVKRHMTWAECERLVKGKNAKFKKAKSPQEEQEILRSWGLDARTSIE